MRQQLNAFDGGAFLISLQGGSSSACASEIACEESIDRDRPRKLAIASDPGFRTMLGLAEGLIPTRQHAWIADTCIECDHQRFGGFLKVSVEELLIALRDDRHLLSDPAGLLSESYGVDEAHEADASESGWSLYPYGFTAERFVEVIETESVWDLQAATRGPTLRSTDHEEVACRK